MYNGYHLLLCIILLIVFNGKYVKINDFYYSLNILYQYEIFINNY